MQFWSLIAFNTESLLDLILIGEDQNKIAIDTLKKTTNKKPSTLQPTVIFLLQMPFQYLCFYETSLIFHR